jgi:hypothetical protein
VQRFEYLMRSILLSFFVGAALSACGSIPGLGARPPDTPPPETSDPVENAALLPPKATPTTPPETPITTPTPTAFLPAPIKPPKIEPTATEELNLPDLQTLPPSDMRLVLINETGKRLIRFTNSIANAGPGRLELIGVPSPSGDQIRVDQHIVGEDDEIEGVVNVGEFIFHSEHDHWHLVDFATYEIWSLDEEDDLVEVVATAGKVSYCVTDTHLIPDPPEESDFPRNPLYLTCQGELQGLLPGWVDVYGANLPGQWVEVTDLDMGRYALVSTVNPEHDVLEADPGNNQGIVIFDLLETSLQIVNLPPAS